MKRTPLNRRQPLRRNPFPRRPPRKSTVIPSTVRAEVEARSGGLCEVRAEGCTGRALHKHHRLRRSQGGQHTVANVTDACPWCHLIAIHGNPEWAYENGWMIRGGSQK